MRVPWSRYPWCDIDPSLQRLAAGEAEIVALQVGARDTWCKSHAEGRAINYTHRICRGPAGLGPVCDNCGLPLKREELTANLTPDYRDEREARLQAFKAGRTRS